MQSSIFFFFNDTATTEIYTLSLHDALPICKPSDENIATLIQPQSKGVRCINPPKSSDRKSTRLNSSHSQISYAVFCLKKKKIKLQTGSITATVTSLLLMYYVLIYDTNR